MYVSIKPMFIINYDQQFFINKMTEQYYYLRTTKLKVYKFTLRLFINSGKRDYRESVWGSQS